jgi:hypothetical protein
MAEAEVKNRSSVFPPPLPFAWPAPATECSSSARCGYWGARAVQESGKEGALVRRGMSPQGEGTSVEG